MPPNTAFLLSTPLSFKQSPKLNLCRRPQKSSCPRRFPIMIQTPDGEGPPDLDVYFDKTRRRVGTEGPPVAIATGRGLLSNHSTTSATASAALSFAQQSMSDPQICHVTYSLDMNPEQVYSALNSALQIPIIGRSVNKKESQGTVEVLLLKSDCVGGVTVASASGDDFHQVACRAAKEAMDKLQTPCTFLIFSHSPGDTAVVRQGIDEAREGVVAYGGPAVGQESDGSGWTLLRETVQNEGCTVHVAAVPGSLPFLLSAVIKTWAQPKYTESLSFMQPTYVGDAKWDLLTAIRYDDWEKFESCIEKEGIDVNVKWESKQNQIPLLAACARARTKMVRYLLDRGADVSHRNDGGFTAVMYTRMLADYDRKVIDAQLNMLQEAGADVNLTGEEREKLSQATGGRFVD